MFTYFATQKNPAAHHKGDVGYADKLLRNANMDAMDHRHGCLAWMFSIYLDMS